VVVRIERTAPRSEAVTAARASAHALFRQLFPGEILTPGQLVSVSTTTFLVTRLLDSGDFYTALGDAKAFALMHEHFRILDDCIRKEGGALVKTVGEGVLAVFNDAVAAVRTALELWNALASSSNTSSLRLGVALHRGPAMVATLNDHLDYFGTTVNTAWQLLAFGQVGEIIATSAVTADGQVAALLQSRRLMLEVLSEASLPNLVVERIVPRSGI
jgi:class 3 adenylate cyclase